MDNYGRTYGFQERDKWIVFYSSQLKPKKGEEPINIVSFQNVAVTEWHRRRTRRSGRVQKKVEGQDLRVDERNLQTPERNRGVEWPFYDREPRTTVTVERPVPPPHPRKLRPVFDPTDPVMDPIMVYLPP